MPEPMLIDPLLARSGHARSADADRQLNAMPKPPKPVLSPADSARHKRCWLRAARKLIDAHRAEFLTLYRAERDADTVTADA